MKFGKKIKTLMIISSFFVSDQTWVINKNLNGNPCVFSFIPKIRKKTYVLLYPRKIWNSTYNGLIVKMNSKDVNAVDKDLL